MIEVRIADTFVKPFAATEADEAMPARPASVRVFLTVEVTGPEHEGLLEGDMIVVPITLSGSAVTESLAKIVSSAEQLLPSRLEQIAQALRASLASD